MGKILGFKSCAVGGEFYGFGQVTPTSYWYLGIGTNQANTQAQINATYADDPNLNGQVVGIGYGWQQYTLPSSGKIKFSVRGAAGGTTGKAGCSIDPVTGNITGTCNKPGRGAKVEGTAKLKKGDILYILVGMRGWCNNGSDYGSGGGGASAVLLDNPSGAYTFAPLGRKVDVLFVAGGGGGCYDSSFGNANYWGNDALYTNGTNTNGGTSSSSRGGAGLTGNGANGSGGNPAYSLLSGTPSITTLNTVHYGGWGGGGGSYDGGGSGGGYSGGSSRGNSQGGNGGTSYINPSLCEETFRGYATVADDGHRNMPNPWSAYGYVELELGRSEDKLILAHDSDGYKYFDGTDTITGKTNLGATNEWKLLPHPQTVPIYDDYYRYGDTIITNRTGLQDNVRFLVSSGEPEENISIDALVNRTLVKMNQDVTMADISVLQSISAVTSLANATVKFAASKDYGKTWQTYNGGQWVDIDISNLVTFQSNGYDMGFFSAIPVEDFNSYNAKNIRFAFCIEQTGYSAKTAILSAINVVADLLGSWRHFTESQASYEYITDDTVEITFKEAGNYKVNYLDSLNAGGND